MTQSREVLQMESLPTPVTTFEKKTGYFITHKIGTLFILFYIVSVVATGLLVYNFASCDLSAQTISSSHLDNATISAVITDLKQINITELTTPNNEKEKIDVRLPRAIRPDTYDVKLVPFIFENNFTFHGDIKILLNVTQNTSNITLHINDLIIDPDSVKIFSFSSEFSNENSLHFETSVIDSFSNDTERQFFIIHVKSELLAGKQYVVTMQFVGNLNNALQGFYRSSYSVGNDTRWIATTQFQPTDARRAFPCFDEPAMKAKFKISIARPKNMTSISNMPAIRRNRTVYGLPDYLWDDYQESVPMSTYLVAFVVSDFESLTNQEKFSVWARKEALEQAKYSLDAGPKILKYFETYFNISFPLPKVDMVALPDFAAGAMENWGLITYRETAMLYENGVSTTNNKQRVATVVSHELAHQWFGNLVTPTWWSDLWLNEGFASYVEYLGVDAIEPTWKVLEQFVTAEVQNVFGLDALQTSHPISVEVRHPNEINEIFDRISYGKGASLIRMMDHFLTRAVFKKGLSNYLNKHKFSNAEQDDLWDALTKQAHQDQALPFEFTIKTIMDTWTLQTGFPLVTVLRNYEKRSALLHQERFLLFKPNNGTDKTEGLWWIPITYTSSENIDFTDTYPSHWMKAEPMITLERLPDSKHWLIFNIQQTGFYRVNYDDTNWRLLINYLHDSAKFEKIGINNRAQLIDDSLNLARAGLLDYDTAMNVTKYLQHETEFLPWKSAFTGFAYINHMLIRTGDYDKFKVFMLRLMDKLYDHVGFKDDPSDPQLIIYKRVHVLLWACSMGHKDCVKNSVVQFQNWRSTPDPDKDNPISANLKSVVYCTAIQVGGQEEWDFAWERYKRANVGTEKELLLQALGCSRTSWILTRYMDWAISESNGIRKQDASRVFSAVASNPIGHMLAFNFVREQWDRIKNYLGQSLFTVSSIVRTSTKKMNTKYELNDLINFAQTNRNDLGTANRAVDQAIEQAAANIQWMENNFHSIVRWLKAAVR